jgi:hypothetical protein
VDFVYWLRRLREVEERNGKELPAFIEHLRTMDEMTRAWQHIRQCAQKAGLMA